MSAAPNKISWPVPHYLDASAAVKLFVDEKGSIQLREYFRNFDKNWSYHFHITEFAFYETLSGLKRSLLKNEEKYIAAVAGLIAYLEGSLLQIDSDFRLDNLNVIYEVGDLVKKHSLDYSDALQIYTVLKGKWKSNCAECTTVFVTADCSLAKAAGGEGLRVWNVLEEANPPDWDKKQDIT